MSMCLRKSARVQICSSVKVPFHAGMPLQRMPCDITQKEWPSASSSTPSVASCGGDGYSPLAIGEAEGACGAPGPFLLPVGISSSYHIAKFFGIAVTRASSETNTVKISLASLEHAAGPVLEGEVLEKDEEPIWRQEPMPPVTEIGAVINKALRAAGLIKE